MTVEKIYFDMDGVLANFEKGIKDLCGLELHDQEKDNLQADEKMWKAVRENDHFYAHLELMPGSKKLFDTLYERYGDRCEILTAIPKKERGVVTAEEDKTNWVREKLSEHIPVQIVYKEQKKDYCTGKGCILIDDYVRNIEEWKACGGTGILFTNAEETEKSLREIKVL